jgi:hypothetical protein
MATKKKFKLCKMHIALIFIIAVIALFVFVMKPTAKTEVEMEIPPAPSVTPPAATLPAAEEPATVEKTLNYTFPSGVAPPSLKITSLINTPTFPKVGETDLIRIYVKNVGSDSGATTATLTINSQIVATMDVPALERNAETVLKYNYTATATGDYTVEVNVAAVPGEEFIDDNYSKITITVY